MAAKKESPKALKAVKKFRGFRRKEVRQTSSKKVTTMANIWTEEDQKTLVAMLEAGASAQRIGVRLKRPTHSVKTRAKELGKPFPLERELTRARRKLLYPSE